MDRILRFVAILSIFLAFPAKAAPGDNNACPQNGAAAFFLSLDGVELQGCLPFSPASDWIFPRTGQALQTAYTQGSGQGFSITAIPFGTAPAVEVFPAMDASTSEGSLREILRLARLKLGAQVLGGPSAQLFGRPVESLVSTISGPGAGMTPQSTRLTEWLVVAGRRLWVFRAIQPAVDPGISPVEGLVFTSPNADAPSTSAAALRNFSRQAGESQSGLALQNTPPYSLPDPRWWSGTCDKNRYSGAYPLGTSFRNVIACGPLPGLGYPDVLVYFYPGAFPALEWECVELVFRFMYLAYGVAPYAANGNGIVSYYQGSAMEKISNGIPGKAPVPGDVISYCPYCTYGHASVVISASVNGSGNGSITVMEQNWSWAGRTTLPVSNWTVIGDAGWVYGWLHPKTSPPQPPTPLPTCTPTPTPIPTPAATPIPGDFISFFPWIHNISVDNNPCR